VPDAVAELALEVEDKTTVTGRRLAIPSARCR
jgi:hypothetical protein